MIRFEKVHNIQSDLQHCEDAARELYTKAWQTRDERYYDAGWQQLEKLKQLQLKGRTGGPLR